MPKKNNLVLNLTENDISLLNKKENIDLYSSYYPSIDELKQIESIDKYNSENCQNCIEIKDSDAKKNNFLQIESNKYNIHSYKTNESIDNIYINTDYTQLNSVNNNLENLRNLNKYEYINSVCWNCCHFLDKNCIPVPLPIKYDEIKNIFVCYGIFCSFNCALLYNITYKIKDSSHLLYYLYKKCNIKNLTDNYFTQAPPRETLQMFGGILTIEQYRQNFKTLNTFDIYTYPVIFVNREIHQHIKYNYQDNSNNSNFIITQSEQIEIPKNKNKNKELNKNRPQNILEMLNVKIK